MNPFMRQIIVIVAMLALVASSAIAGGSSVTEKGSIEIDAGHQFGNDSTGGFVLGSVNGSYQAKDRKDAWGETEGSVLLKGKSFENDHFAKSSALGKVESSAKADGNQLSKVAVNGEVTQGNWTSLTDGENFVSSRNITTADYLGKQSGRYFTGADGSATAGGESFSSLKSTPNETKASSGTSGFSNGVLNMQGGDPLARGFGKSVVGISMTRGDTSGAAYAEGNSNYAAQGANAAKGSLKIATEADIKMLSDGIKITAGASSSSKASSK